MQDILTNAPFILTFLGGVAFSQMTIGTQPTITFLWLVLAGMIITNSELFMKLIGKGVSTHG